MTDDKPDEFDSTPNDSPTSDSGNQEPPGDATNGGASAESPTENAGAEESSMESGGESAEQSSESKDPPPGMLPLGPKVFGRFAFLITAVPFLIYWGGSAIGNYLETTRKIAPVHQIRSICGGEIGSPAGVDAQGNEVPATQLFAAIEQLPESQQREVENRFRLSAVKEAMDDENAGVESLKARCEPFLEADPRLAPPQLQSEIYFLQRCVEHFLELETYAEEDELNKIIPANDEFWAEIKGAAKQAALAEIEADPKVPGETEALSDSTSVEEAEELFETEHEDSWYPVAYSIVCLASFVAVLLAMPGYLTIPFRVSPLAVIVGVVGIFVWIGLWWLDREFLHIGSLISSHSRAAFNPLQELKANPTWMYTFLAIRLLGLVIVIPIAEEFFTKAFLIRYIEDIDWDQIPMGMATWKGIVGMIAYGCLAHPGEIVAAAAWFGMVTWLYLKTKNVWDCVIAHGITNLLLAIFVLATGTWVLW